MVKTLVTPVSIVLLLGLASPVAWADKSKKEDPAKSKEKTYRWP